MKREELKEKIEQKFGEACGRYVVLVDMDAIMTLIDEYTKPKKKTKSLEERKKQFFNDVCKHDCDEFASMSFCEFIDYWTEHNEGGKKMRFEMAKNQPFNIKRRLATWKRNQKNYNNGTTTTKTDAANEWLNS